MRETDIRRNKYCEERKCFVNTDFVFLKNEATNVLLRNRGDQWSYLEGLLEPNSGLFYFAGNPLFYRFLEYSFTFSRDPHISVKGTKGSKKVLTIRNIPRDSDAPQQDSVTCSWNAYLMPQPIKCQTLGKSTYRISRKLLFKIGSVKVTHAYEVMWN